MAGLTLLALTIGLVIDSCYSCGFVTDLQKERFQLEETAKPGTSTLIEIQVTPNVRRIDFSSGGPENTKYFDFVLDRTTGKVHLLPKDALATFFDNSDSDAVEVLSPKIKCNDGSEFVSTYPIHIDIVDVNDKAPEFSPPLNKVFNIQLPYRGAPINWDQVLRVRDGDHNENNTNLQFYAEPEGLVKIMPNPPVKVMANGRLQHYEVYFGLEDSWEAPGLFPVTIMATDGEHFDSVSVDLNITRGPDVERPTATENRAYHRQTLNNTVGETVPVATITDDTDATQDLFILVQGKFGNKFGVLVNGTAVTLQLKRAFTPQQLADTGYLVRVTLLATDTAGNSASLPLALQFQAPPPSSSCEEQPATAENEIPAGSKRSLDNTLPPAELVAEGIHLTVTTDANDTVTSIGANLTGDIQNKFEVAMQPDGTVFLRLKDEFLDQPMELVDNEWLIRLTMTVTDETNLLTPRQQRELAEGKRTMKVSNDTRKNTKSSSSEEEGGEKTTTVQPPIEESTENEGGLEFGKSDAEDEVGAEESRIFEDQRPPPIESRIYQPVRPSPQQPQIYQGQSLARPRVYPIPSAPQSQGYQPQRSSQQQARFNPGQRPSPGQFGNNNYQAQGPVRPGVYQQPSSGQFGSHQGQQPSSGQFGSQQGQQPSSGTSGYYQGTDSGLYQAERPPPPAVDKNICTEEGFFPDPHSCTKFHRCVYDVHRGKFTDYKMECGPGVDLWCQSTLSCSFSYQCPEKCAAQSTNDYDDQDFNG